MAGRKQRRKCIICGVRPAPDGGGYCKNCDSHVKALTRRKTEEAEHYVVYKGIVVGFFANGRKTRDGQRLFTPKLLNRNPDRLPRRKTYNLDGYVKVLDRQQVKKMKACVKTLAHC